MGKARAAAQRFDEGYYRRFYGSRDPVHGPRQVGRLARGVTALCAHFGQPIASVLDVGAGIGLWRDWFARHLPRARVRSIDVSPWACRRYGHERRDIARFRARERFDLIVCHGVLQYLDDAEAARAVENLGAMSRGLLYLEAITRRDAEGALDREASDTDVHLRPASFYRALLRPHFRRVGGGLWAQRESALVFYELEADP